MTFPNLGRRMPQNRRTLMMKQRASSLSTLAAHSADPSSQDSSSNRLETTENLQKFSLDSKHASFGTAEITNGSSNTSEPLECLTDVSESVANGGAGVVVDTITDEGECPDDEVTATAHNGTLSTDKVHDVDRITDVDPGIDTHDSHISDDNDNNNSISDSGKFQREINSNKDMTNVVFAVKKVDCFNCCLCASCRDCNCEDILSVDIENGLDANLNIPNENLKESHPPEIQTVDIESLKEFADEAGEKLLNLTSNEQEDKKIYNEISVNQHVEVKHCSKCNNKITKASTINSVDEKPKMCVENKTRKTDILNMENFLTPAKIETIEIDTFDDIDDALFFKPSGEILDSFRPSNSELNGRQQSKRKSKMKSKKRLTIDNKSHRDSMRSNSNDGALGVGLKARFRQTLASFRRVRLNTDSELSDCHPDEITNRKKTTYCVLL